MLADATQDSFHSSPFTLDSASCPITLHPSSFNHASRDTGRVAQGPAHRLRIRCLRAALATVAGRGSRGGSGGAGETAPAAPAGGGTGRAPRGGVGVPGRPVFLDGSSPPRGLSPPVPAFPGGAGVDGLWAPRGGPLWAR